MPSELNLGFEESRSIKLSRCSIFLLWYDGIVAKRPRYANSLLSVAAGMRGAWPMSTARIYFAYLPITPMLTSSISPATTSRFWTIKAHT